MYTLKSILTKKDTNKRHIIRSGVRVFYFLLHFGETRQLIRISYFLGFFADWARVITIGATQPE